MKNKNISKESITTEKESNSNSSEISKSTVNDVSNS